MNNIGESVEQLDPTEQLPTEVIKKRAVRGAAILTVRTIVIQLISFISIALLTFFLEPLEFGIFFLVSAVINFLKYFSDIGFAAALIQKKDSLKDEDLKTIFTIQQILIIVILLVVFSSTSLIKNIYNLNQDSIYLLWALAFSLLLSSLKTIPSVILERRLEFNKLVIPEILETIVFNLTTVYLAWKGFGVTSFTVGVILRGLMGLVALYFIQPWIPGLAFSRQSLKSLLKFGIPYQLNTFLAMVKDDGMTLFLGGILGPSGIGLLGWAQKWAYAPLRFFMDQVIKVTFPAFSRLQDNKNALSDTVSKAIFFICLLVFPALVLLVLSAPTLTEVIPKYNKWSPALLALALLSITSAFAAVTTPLTNMLNATGKISVTFKLMVMWTILTWVFVPLLAILYGLNGAALGFILVGLSSIVGIFVASRFININYLQIVGKPITASFFMGVLVLILQTLLSQSLVSMTVTVITGFFVYSLIILLMEPKLLILIKGLKLFLLLIFIAFLLLTPKELSANSNFVSIVNPVRGEDFWEGEEPVEKGVLGQLEILKQRNLPATFLLRFDVLSQTKIVEALKNSIDWEKGLFLEVTPAWTKKADVSYRRSDNWHNAGSAFLSGYERDERVKLVDSAFDEYKKVFGTFPKSVGAWWIDSFSLTYMQQKYGIASSLIVADQYSTDNYQIWGQYFGVPFYPSKNNALHPAQTVENKLDVVMMQWASRDPVNGYGKGVEESTFSVQANDYTDYHNLDSRYFSSLVDIYTKQGLNKFSHLVVGLENSYSWDKYRREYQNQIKILAEKKNAGQLSIVTMEDFARWYKSNFPALSPAHIIEADDPLGTSKKAVWFMNPYFRAGWFFNQEGSVFRDIRQYIDGEEELCFLKRCDQVNFATFSTRVLDDVSFGHKWVIDEGKLTDVNVKKRGDNFVITYTNEADTERSLEFLPRDISLDGKISSIDGVILEATKQQLERQNQIFLEKGSFSWSFDQVFIKTLKFLIFIILGSLVPGFLLINKILPEQTPTLQKIILAQILGLVIVTLLFYTLSIIQARQMIFLYPLINLLFLVKLRKQIARNFSFKINDKFNFLIIGLTFAGVIFQQLPTFKNGLHFLYGLGFWGPNTHDGIWHISLINQLVGQVPPQNPVFAGESLKNYHYFYDLLVAVTNYLSGIPIGDLLFRFYPVTFSVILGIATYYLAKSLFRLKKDLQGKLGIFLILYLVYFAGSFGWIVEYINMQHLGGESAFWANQSISFNLNPPFAISLLIVIVILQLLPIVKFNKQTIFVLTILISSLISFKAYAGILILLSLFLFSIFKKSYFYLIVFLTSSVFSSILFLSNFSLGKQLIIFSPFWFIHSMIDSPDRVGWARLSLARVTGWEGGNWFKFLTAEAISFGIFLIGNLGTRTFALLALLKLPYIVRRADFLFIFIFSALSFFIPTFFIQEGNPWNTIQFFYYFLYISAVVGGYIFAKIIVKVPKVFALPATLVFILVTPINSWASANGYLPDQPHAFISNQELTALEFLKSQKMGIVLTYPYDAKLKQRIAEPWPILVYDSTAYISAFSGKSLFLEDEGQNQILLTDYKKRKVLSKDFFARPNRGFLKDNNIRYVYLPKLFGVSLDFDSFLKQIYQNEEVYIYEIE